MYNESLTHIIDVYWEGPYNLDNIDKFQEDNSHCLYQVYGHHPIYGNDVLLYLGKTEKQGITTRIKQHKWINNQSDNCKIFVASCSVFEDWKKWKNDQRERYVKYDSNRVSIENIESLLIYAHQPSYNGSKLKSVNFGHHPFRIFNSGKRKSLFPEISTQFYTDVMKNRPEE